jgi:hypothetical protein
MKDFRFLLSMPGGAEWILIILLFSLLLLFPILTIVFYVQNRNLKKQNSDLLNLLSEKK